MMTPMELDRANTELRYLLAQQCALIEQQAKEMARLREALADIKRDCELCDWCCPTCETDYGMCETDLYSHAKQALKEEHP